MGFALRVRCRVAVVVPSRRTRTRVGVVAGTALPSTYTSCSGFLSPLAWRLSMAVESLATGALAVALVAVALSIGLPVPLFPSHAHSNKQQTMFNRHLLEDVGLALRCDWYGRRFTSYTHFGFSRGRRDHRAGSLL